MFLIVNIFLSNFDIFLLFTHISPKYCPQQKTTQRAFYILSRLFSLLYLIQTTNKFKSSIIKFSKFLKNLFLALWQHILSLKLTVFLLKPFLIILHFLTIVMSLYFLVICLNNAYCDVRTMV